MTPCIRALRLCAHVCMCVCLWVCVCCMLHWSNSNTTPHSFSVFVFLLFVNTLTYEWYTHWHITYTHISMINTTYNIQITTILARTMTRFLLISDKLDQYQFLLFVNNLTYEWYTHWHITYTHISMIDTTYNIQITTILARTMARFLISGKLDQYQFNFTYHKNIMFNLIRDQLLLLHTQHTTGTHSDTHTHTNTCVHIHTCMHA